MPPLYPASVSPENFRVGDQVRKYVNQYAFSPYTGIVTHIVPSTYKVWVQWPFGNSQPEDPEYLVKVNPVIVPPVVVKDNGYSSYERSISERLYGKVPKVIKSSERMAIRIAHSFATNVIGKLVDDIVECRDQGFTDIQTYNRLFKKYGYCSDHILRSSIEKIYKRT